MAIANNSSARILVMPIGGNSENMPAASTGILATSSLGQVHSVDDVELEQETDLRQFGQWVMRHYNLDAFDPPADSPLGRFVATLRDEELLAKALHPIFAPMKQGDVLWLCRSREIGPLPGHRGIALVRHRRPIVYVRVVQY